MPVARLATLAELGAIQAITDAAYAPYVEELGQPPLPMTADYTALVQAGSVWLVAQDGLDIALAVLEAEPDHLLIFSLAVRPEAHGGGIGRWMLAFAEDQAQQRGLPEVRLYTNARMTRNIRIYTEAGYREQGRRPNPHRPGWIIVDMAKHLGEVTT